MDDANGLPKESASARQPAAADGAASPRQPEPRTPPTDAGRAHTEQDRQFETGEESPT